MNPQLKIKVIGYNNKDCKIILKKLHSILLMTLPNSIKDSTIKDNKIRNDIFSSKGKIFLPLKKKKLSVIRSPFVYSYSKEQFEMRISKANFTIRNTSPFITQIFIKNMLKNNLVTYSGIVLEQNSYNKMYTR